MVSRTIPVDPFDLVIFGGTGDLARRKILPGLFRRFLAGQMPEDARVIGCARGDLTDTAYRKMIKEAIEEFTPKTIRKAKDVSAFVNHLHYVKVDALGTSGWKDLKAHMRDGVIRAFYFSVGAKPVWRIGRAAAFLQDR